MWFHQQLRCQHLPLVLTYHPHSSSASYPVFFRLGTSWDLSTLGRSRTLPSIVPDLKSSPRSSPFFGLRGLSSTQGRRSSSRHRSQPSNATSPYLLWTTVTPLLPSAPENLESTPVHLRRKKTYLLTEPLQLNDFFSSNYFILQPTFVWNFSCPAHLTPLHSTETCDLPLEKESLPWNLPWSYPRRHLYLKCHERGRRLAVKRVNLS